MSKVQRAKVDAMLRQPQPQGPVSIEQARAGFRAFMSTMIVPGNIVITRTTLGDRPASHVMPAAQEQRNGTILYFHGGSYSLGSPETGMSLTGNLVVRTGFPAYSLDYRLAPEHPFPAALDDGLSAYRALLDAGTDPAALAFAGDSAGGNLAITTCLAARDAGLPLPAAVVAFSPGLDFTRSGASVDGKLGKDPFFTREGLARTGDMYLAGQDPRHPLASPAIAGDLTGFPPLLLQAGTNELLLDDSTRMAARARDFGVDVILDVTADVPHVFQGLAGVLDEAGEALDRAAFFLTQRLKTV